MVYFMQSVDGGAIKIGYSDDVDRRRMELEVTYGCPLAILATMPGGEKEEAIIHRQFDHLRLKARGRRGKRPEQFRPAPELMAYIRRPLLVDANPDAIEAMAAERTVVIHLKGTAEYAAWLDGLHRATLVQKASIVRWALQEWAEKRGLPEPPQS